MTDATRYMARAGSGDFNNLFGEYLCLLKSVDWAYEQEWRVIYAIGPDHANFPLEMPVPSAIILGTAVEAKNAKFMEEFCVMRSITLKRAVRSGSAAEIIVA